MIINKGMIKQITYEYPDIHLIELIDGRLIGINSEYVCLYKDFDHFFDSEINDIPTINLKEN